MKPSNAKFGNSSHRGSKFTGPPRARSFNPHKSLTGWRGATKRSIDVVLSMLGLIVLSPLFAAIAAAVWLTDRGPILYRQTRVGLGGRPFTMIKFRTMFINAEQDLGAIWSVPRDPRCTRIGQRLRRAGLDELPQLWNILRGEMSLVGPRPERPEFTREFRKEHLLYDVRLTVRSGLTGFAQIHGWRGYTSMEQRLLHDVYYVRNWSLALDAWILLMTIVRGWSEKTRIGVR